ncbi:RuBisCO large subunit-binding protein subunit alpha, partial [Tanacetum coccineum]
FDFDFDDLPEPQITPNITSNRVMEALPVAADVKNRGGVIVSPRLKLSRRGCSVRIGGSTTVDLDLGKSTMDCLGSGLGSVVMVKTLKPKLPYPLPNPSPPKRVSPATSSAHSSNSDLVHSSDLSTDGPFLAQTPPVPDVQTPTSSAAHADTLSSVAPAATPTTIRVFPPPHYPVASLNLLHVVATKTNDTYGNGTTTVLVLAREVTIHAWFISVTSVTKLVSSKKAIASISYGNGDIIGVLIVDAIDKVRPYGLSMGKGPRVVYGSKTLQPHKTLIRRYNRPLLTQRMPNA